LACWPPGPPDATKRKSISFSGTRQPSVTARFRKKLSTSSPAVRVLPSHRSWVVSRSGTPLFLPLPGHTRADAGLRPPCRVTVGVSARCQSR
jgi:hypothetical protein